MRINKRLIPFNYNLGQESRIKYIVLHYVGSTGEAEANCQYYASQYTGASKKQKIIKRKAEIQL